MNARVMELFDELVDLTPEARSQYLADHKLEGEIRSEVEQLLAFDSGDSAPFLRGVSGAARQVIDAQDASGQRCGSYRLMDVIGRGGMGVVYIAERADGEVNHRAAVKLLQPWLQHSQRERFLQERQILAALKHPNIAHLLDAGHLPNGEPFLAMEYVDGKPIDVYSAELSIRQKVRLFLKVCSAVAYLHRNLIVHRDLKPGNIIVTEEGEPKLLDFGIARILDPDSTMTSTGMLTPAYASPEQLTGGRISTASDIYSLGAVLYQLLTGRSPHQCDGESPASHASAVLSQEITRPGKWAPGIKGDLELILLKTLRKEPQERYGSAEQLADDLEAFLESRPIRLRQGDLLYRARKVARKYWAPLAAAALTFAGLLGGLYMANRERAVAQQRFSEVHQLSNRLFDIDKQVLKLHGSSKTRQLIVDTSLDYLRRLAADAKTDPDLALDLGAAYMRVGRVQGVAISPNLGQTANAEESLQTAEKLVRSVLEVQPGNRTAFLRYAQIAHDRMILAQERRVDTPALALARQSAQWLDRYLASGPIDEGEKNQVVIVGMNVANWYVRKELMEEGSLLLRRTIEIATRTNQPNQAAAAQIVMARALRSNGDLEGALVAIREAVRILEPSGDKSTAGASHRVALTTLGAILGEDGAVSLGRPREAAEYLQRSFNISLDAARHDPHDAFSRFSVSNSGTKLANIVRHQNPLRAIEIYDEVLRRLAEIRNNPRARREEVAALIGSTHPLRKLGRFREAGERLTDAFANLEELKLYPAEAVGLGSEADDALRARAEYEAARGNPRQGLSTYKDLLSRITASKTQPESNLADAVELSDMYAAMARLSRRAGETSTFEHRRLELWRHWNRRLPNNSLVARHLVQTF